jgi:tetratricopeptide (TPR) repeat protein
VRGASAEDEGWRLEARAEALLASGDLDGADDAYGRLGATAGAAEAARLGRARVARERGDLDGALVLLSEVADPRAPMERAQVLEELGRISEAETTWKRVALSTDLEQRSAGVVGLARVRLSRDDAKGALEALAGLSAPDPGYALTYAQARGEALLAVGRFDEARAVYVALNADAEARVVGLLGQAEVDLAVDRPRDALPRFEAALAAATDPWYQAVARGGVVRALADSGDVTKARAAYASLLATFPDRDDVLSGAAAALGIER